MMESILTSVKKIIGLDESYTAFDQDLIIHINTVLVILNQMGVGEDAFMISGNTETWNDFLGDDNNLSHIKTYLALKVRKIFDPPMTSSVTQAIDENIKELEWRISVAVDPPLENTEV